VDAKGSKKSREAVVYDQFKSSHPWLVLHSRKGNDHLGCEDCERHAPRPADQSKRKGFMHGAYQLGKYFYERALQQHEASKTHGKATQAPAASSVPTVSREPTSRRAPSTPQSQFSHFRATAGKKGGSRQYPKLHIHI
jgi:hypothetical protein